MKRRKNGKRIFLGLLVFYAILMLLVGLSLPTMASSFNFNYTYDGVEDIIEEVTTELEEREISSDSVIVIGFGSEENQNKPMAIRAAKTDVARIVNSLEKEGENLKFQKSWSVENSEGAVFYIEIYQSQ